MNRTLFLPGMSARRGLRRSAAVLSGVTLLATVSACATLVPMQAAPTEAGAGAGAVTAVPDAARLPIPAQSFGPALGTVDAAQANADVSGKKPSPPVAGVQPAAVGPVLKCWQEGRLIVETRIQELPPHAASVQTMRDAISGSAIYAFDLQRAFCVAQ